MAALIVAFLPMENPTSASAAGRDDAAHEAPIVSMVEVRAQDFRDKASRLPPELVGALARDVGLSGEEYLARAEAATRAVDVVADLESRIDLMGNELDGTELVVYVDDAEKSAIVEAAGARAVIGEPERPDPEQYRFESTADLRGGVPYFFSPGARCSLGFTGFAVSNGNRRAITAGHCDGNLTATRQVMTAGAPNVFGPSSQWQELGAPVSGSFRFGGGYDHGLLAVSAPGWVQKPEVVTWGFDAPGAPLSSDPVVLTDATPAIAGAPICKSGGTTGWTCGTIDTVDLSVEVGGYEVNTIYAEICVLRGDSGGAAVTGSTALGVVSGSNAGAECGDGLVNGPNGNEVPGTEIGVFAPLYSAAAESAETLYNGNWEPMVLVNNSFTATRSELTLSGTVVDATPRHRVQITVSGSYPVYAAIQPDGSWSRSLAASVTSRTYSVRVVWGTHSRTGAAVTGTIPPSFTVDRAAGADRYSTAVQISQRGFTGSDLPVPIVFIAAGESFPDALSAGSAAATLGGPLLLTARSSVPSVVRSELRRLNPERIVVVGGSSVVTSSVISTLRGFTSGSVIRLGGVDRYDTSRKIAQFAFGNREVTEAYVATGTGFPDALSAAAAAAGRGVPVILVPGNASNAGTATRNLLRSLDLDRIYIAGGTAVVSSSMASWLRGVAPTTRLAGSDRFGTSLAINQHAHSSAKDAHFAYALNFPDALAGSVLAGLRGGPMYSVPRSCIPRTMYNHMLSLGVTEVTLFGGSSVLTSGVAGLRHC